MPTIPSCSTGKVRFLVINVLNDYRICMCLIVCSVCEFRDKILLSGGECKTRENFKFKFFKKKKGNGAKR